MGNKISDDIEIRRLETIYRTLEKMSQEQRKRLFEFFLSKYFDLRVLLPTPPETNKP